MGRIGHGINRFANDIHYTDRLPMQVKASFLDAHNVKYLAHQVFEPGRGIAYAAYAIQSLLLGELQVQKRVNITTQHRDRGPQLVGNGDEKTILHLFDLLLLTHITQDSHRRRFLVSARVQGSDACRQVMLFAVAQDLNFREYDRLASRQHMSKRTSALTPTTHLSTLTTQHIGT